MRVWICPLPEGRKLMQSEPLSLKQLLMCVIALKTSSLALVQVMQV